MKNATQKQVNYLLTLDPTLDVESLKNISIRDASIMIAKYKKTSNKEQKEIKKEITFLSLDQLLDKYNARVEQDNEGWHGLNYLSMTRDSRTFKSILVNAIKNEFNGIKADVRVSFASTYYHPVTITFKGTKKEMFKPYFDFKEDELYNSILWRRDWKNGAGQNLNSWSDKTAKRIFDHYLTNLNHELAEEDEILLTPEYAKAYHFIRCLLDSYSYNHSDIMTDYFDSGFNYQINICADDGFNDYEESKKAYDFFYGVTKEEQILEKYPLEAGEDEILAQRFQAWQEQRQAEIKHFEEQRAKEQAEREERERVFKAGLEECKKHYTIREIPDVEEQEKNMIYNCSFSHWNKACTLDEVLKNNQDPGLEGGKFGTAAQICKVVNFDNQESFDFLCNHLMYDWDFCNCGGCCHASLETLEELNYEKCYYMSQEEQEARGIVWVRLCVLIQLNGVDKLVIDPEGHSYCRYVGTLEKATKEKPVLEQAFDPETWLSEEDKKQIEDIKTSLQFGDRVDFFDFGAKRPKNPVFWKELEKLGKVTKNEMSWGVCRA